MEVRNRLPKTDPYAESKTELQWRAEGRAVIDLQGSGKEMWSNQFCNTAPVYYIYNETRPATPEELTAWKEESRSKAQERKRRRQEEMIKEERWRQAEIAAEAERESKRIKALCDRLHQYSSVNLADIICLDCETTGLSSEDEILQLSIVNVAGEILFNEYVRPINASEWPEAERIHGVSPAMVADKHTIDFYREQISDIMAKAGLIIGYNVSFDLEFLRCAGVEWSDEIPVFDVMEEFAEVYGEWSSYYGAFRWQNLRVCASYFGYKRNGSFHDSLEDAKATIFCYNAMTALTMEDLRME